MGRLPREYEDSNLMCVIQKIANDDKRSKRVWYHISVHFGDSLSLFFDLLMCKNGFSSYFEQHLLRQSITPRP